MYEYCFHYFRFFKNILCHMDPYRICLQYLEFKISQDGIAYISQPQGIKTDNNIR